MQGAGTYMFRIDDDRVIDATRAGSIAHLINHSCDVCITFCCVTCEESLAGAFTYTKYITLSFCFCFLFVCFYLKEKETSWCYAS